MVDTNKPIDFRTMEDNPLEIMQTGYPTIKIYTVEMQVADVDFGVITDENDLRNEEAWSGVADSDTDLAEDVPITQYLMRGLGGQYYDWIYDRAYTGTWANIATSDTTEIMFDFYTEFRQALNGRKPFTYKDDGTTAATTLAEAIQGFDWNDEGIGGVARHYQWLHRLANFQGFRYRKLVPKLTDKLDAATETNRIRIEMILSALAAMELVYLFPMLAIQSERAMFALAAHHEHELNRKFPDPEALAGTVDPIWIRFTKPNRFDVTGANITDYKGQTGRWINTDALQGDPLDQAFKRARNTYRVPVMPVNFAKLFAGIMKSELHDTEEHIAMLWTFHPADDVAYDAISASAWTHGDSEWILGLDLSFVLDFLRIMQELDVEGVMRTLVNDRQHYSWSGDELGKIVDDMWVDFNFTRTLSGYASPVIHRALDRHLRFEATGTKTEGSPVTGGTLWFRPASELLDGADMATLASADPEDLDDTNFTGQVNNQWMWLTAFIWDYMDPEMRLLSTGGMTLEEMAADFMLGMLLDSNKPHDDRDQVLQYKRLMAVEMIDSYNQDKNYGFSCAATTKNQPRFGDVYDYLNYSSTFVYQNALTLHSPGDAFTRVYSAPRPKGIRDRKMTYVSEWGHRETKLAMFDVMWSLLGSNSPIKPIEEKPPDKSLEGVSDKERSGELEVKGKEPLVIPSKPPDPKKPSDDDE